jgi:methylthioribose-1-phosphate isomerase
MARSDPADDAPDPSRRQFFRTFGRETVRQAGAVAGAAAELRRSSLAAARVLFDPDAPATDSARAADSAPAAQVDRSAPDATFRSAYRFTGTEIVALDARQLPGRVETIVLVEPSEVASAIRVGAINGGPVLAELGAYALVMAARAAVDRPAVGRDQQVHAAAGTLRAAKQEVRALAWVIDRLEARYAELAGQGSDGTAIADALASEADSIASEAAAAHGRIGRIGARAIHPAAEEPLNLVMHGDMGPLSCGLVGMGTALIQELRDTGRSVHAWVTEGGPGGEGGRLVAFQLRQLDVPFTVIPDAAVAWLLDHRRVDALLLRGDRVCGNGDCGVLIGGLAAALVAASAGVPVHVLAPRNAVDPGAADGAAIRADTSVDAGQTRLNPHSDVVPAELITSIISERS